MEKNEEERKSHFRDVAQQNAIKRAASIGERKLTPEQEQYKLELRILAAEASGIGSNKSLDQVLREAEEKCIGNPPAANLHGECPGQEVYVAVPACVKDSMPESCSKAAEPETKLRSSQMATPRSDLSCSPLWKPKHLPGFFPAARRPFQYQQHTSNELQKT